MGADMNNQKQAIETILGKFWDKVAIDIGNAPEGTGELGAPLDSLTSMEALIEVDQLLKRKVPVEVVIQKGGYQTREEFVAEITAKVMKFDAENPL
jgi:hypothetical protein